MLRNRIYYLLKPIIPWSLRVALRRLMAARRKAAYAQVWPINEAAGRPPEGWLGWPGGKQFAVVLTHDVEGQLGLDRCRQLMEMEAKLGFRSSFNFVPEGEYCVPEELRNELVRNGFEIGVHDLHHDGKLFRSRDAFERNAQAINRYLHEWNAVGFRAGFMLRRLDWQHDLDILYDASTFDTDPFEPQPDGVNTIFPFWVHCPVHNLPTSRASQTPSSAAPPAGYVELPYTLPQDSTLFLVFREETIDLWKRKLDWVAAKGGMALVNVHPDYLRFPGEPASARTFSVEFYSQLLEYLRDRYAGAYWQPLPKEVAGRVVATKPAIIHRKRCRVCLVSYSVYESDVRVARYGNALIERGDEVDVIALKSDPQVQAEGVVGGARVSRVQTRAGHERSKLSYLLPLLRFLAVSSWRITREHARRPYDLLHIHNVPDFLVFAAIWPKLKGAKVILDIHDIVPEFFTSKFGVSAETITVRLLKLMERRSASFADHVILANHLWFEKYTSRSAPPEKCSVVINHVDRRIFAQHLRSRSDDKQIILFPGGLQWHQGLDIAIRAFGKLKNRLPRAEFHVYGEGHTKPDLVQLTRDLGLEGKVRFMDVLSTEGIAEVMANADLGVVPKRADSFGNEAYSTKIMEFMSVGVPVVVSSTKIDRYYFNDSVVRFFPSGNHEAMAEAMYEVLTNADLRQRLVAQGSEYADANNWEARRGDYLKIVDFLCASDETSMDSGRKVLVADGTKSRG